MSTQINDHDTLQQFDESDIIDTENVSYLRSLDYIESVENSKTKQKHSDDKDTVQQYDESGATQQN